jgi:uncharacterized protein YaiI (UPF0178 family)
MRIYIDADGCPREVRELVERAADKRGVDVTVVANRPLAAPKSRRVTLSQVGAGPDVADDWIAERAGRGDLVVTADVPLAARAVESGAVALTHRGDLLDASNIGERLSLRDFMTEARDTGIFEGGGPKAFDARAKRDFANALDRWITAALRG